MRQKIGIHRRLDGTQDGAAIPMYVRHWDRWVKVGDGKYDAKNQIIDVEIDIDDEAAQKFLRTLKSNDVHSFSIEEPAAHNID